VYDAVYIYTVDKVMNGNPDTKRSGRKPLQAVLLLVSACLFAVAFRSAPAQALSGNWTNTSGGTWSTGTNWSSGAAPNASTDDANFALGSGPQITINVDSAFNVHNLNLTGSRSYRFNGSGQLNLFGNVTILSGQTLTLLTGIALQNDTILNIASGGSLSLATPNAISGNHNITLEGGGFVGNSDPESYTGTTTVQDGTFGSSGGNVFSPNSDFVLANNSDVTLSTCGGDNTIASLSGGAASFVDFCGARLTLGNASDTTYAGTMEDNGNPGGGITKVGTGTFTLTGTNTYTGNTIVNAGTLDVNGALTNSAVTVNAGGTLKGSGTLKGVTVNGTIAPGNSIATITGDSFELASGSTLENEISPTGTTDLINANTSVAIDSGAALKVEPQAGTYSAGQTYTIISAPSITGTFSTVTGTSSALTYQLRYFPTHVDLVVSPVSGASTTTITASGTAAPATGYGSPSRVNLLRFILLAVSVACLASGLALRKRLLPSSS